MEVKGEGDKLSFKQIQWIHYLMECNVSAEVCYVHRNENKYRKKTEDKLKTSNTKNIKAELKNNSSIEISKDPIANDRIEISKDVARYSDTEDNHNRKTKAGPKKYHKRKLVFSNECNTATSDVQDTQNRIKNKPGPKRFCKTEETMQISIDPFATEKTKISQDQIIIEFSKDSIKKVNISNEPNCKSIKILSPALISQINVVMTTGASFALSNNTNPSPVETRNPPTNVPIDFPVIDLTALESPTKEESKAMCSPTKVAMQARRRLEGLGSPSTSGFENSRQEEGVYLRSPTKNSKGVGYFISPPTTPKNYISPSKVTSARNKINLSLTRRRLKDMDK